MLKKVGFYMQKFKINNFFKFDQTNGETSYNVENDFTVPQDKPYLKKKKENI